MKISKIIYIFTLFFIALALPACSNEAPIDSDLNACQILEQKPQWSKSLQQAQEKYNLPPQFALAIIYQESKFVADAKNKYSSAYGYAQAIDQTWKLYQDSVKSNAKRTNFDDSVMFIGWYMSDLSNKLNLKMSDSYNLYMAYMLGQTGYKRYKAGTFKNQKAIQENENIATKVKSFTNQYAKQLKECS